MMKPVKNSPVYCLLASLCVLLSNSSTNASEVDGRWISEKGLFTVSYTPAVEPVPLNNIHEWKLDLDMQDGSPVTGAEIEASGGMPEHDHGMPTALDVTPAEEPGMYLLQGVRFHMMGKWELVLTVRTQQLTDTITINLEL